MAFFRQNFVLTDSFIRDKFILFNTLASLILNLGLWLFLLAQGRDLSALSPLHYNIYFGIDLYAQWYRIFLMPLLGLIFFLINFFISALIFKKEKILSLFLLGAASFAQVILIIAAFFISTISWGI